MELIWLSDSGVSSRKLELSPGGPFRFIGDWAGLVFVPLAVQVVVEWGSGSIVMFLRVLLGTGDFLAGLGLAVNLTLFFFKMLTPSGFSRSLLPDLLREERDWPCFFISVVVVYCRFVQV